MSQASCMISLVLVAIALSMNTVAAYTQPDGQEMHYVVLEGRGQATIVLGDQPSAIEQHAAEELARYVEAMSGSRLRVVAAADGRDMPRRVLIGRAETNSSIAEQCAAGRVRLSPEFPGSDGFVVKTLPHPGGDGQSWDLVVGGSTDRATLYAVYDLLERVWDVGFFWDGDFIPKREALPLPDLDVAERPRFPIRQHLQACAFGYTTYPWEWEDWKQEIDWMAKRRMNRMMLDWGHPLAKRVAAYARGLGIEIILPGAGLAEVTEEFRKVHPEARYVKMQWLEEPPYYAIHPDDPLYVEHGTEVVRKAIEQHGTDHVYNVDPYPEATVFLPPEEIEQMRVAFARRTAEYLRKADPESVWYASGWAMLAPVWPEATARAFLEEAAKTPFYICDIWADEQPIYRKYEYFHGADWGFGVLHAFGGEAGLRGDLASLIRRVQEVVRDPRAQHCVAFYINPEIIRYNILYYEVAARLAWDPEHVNLDEFVERYARRRYGATSAQDLSVCLQHLSRSVYSSASRSWRPEYQVRPQLVDPDPAKFAHLAELEAALRAALRQAHHQRANRLYSNDLVDIGREWLGQLFNREYQALCRAAREGDGKGVRYEVDLLRNVLDTQERLLSTRPEYSVSALIAKAGRARPGEDAARYIKGSMLTFADRPWLRDYSRKDMQGLIQYYYNPRLEAFIRALHQLLPRPENPPTTPNLLRNPSFEEGVEETPDAWTTAFVHAGGSARRVRLPGESRRYTGELQVPVESTYANLYQAAEARESEVFCLSAKVRTAGSGRASLHVDFLRGEAWPADVLGNQSVAALRESSEWAELRGWFEAPAKTVRVVVFCRLEDGKGSAWFDEVALQKVSPEEAPIIRSGPLEAEYETIERQWLEQILPPYEPPETDATAILRAALDRWE